MNQDFESKLKQKPETKDASTMVMSRKKKKLNGKSKDPNSRNHTEERKKKA